jgi:hypothetical protein
MSVALVLCTSIPVPATAQLRGTIAGTITDESGAALPGVTVTMTSPALQVSERIDVSTEQGQYNFVDLEPGTYRLSYALSGFTTLVREGIVLTAGFAARVDTILKVGTLAETVTVSGQSPVVDLTSTRGGATVSREVLTALPNNRTYYDVLILAGGAQMTGAPQSGRAGLGPVANHNVSFGQRARMNNEIEGIRTLGGENPDIGNVGEVDVKTFGRTAESDIPGSLVQIIYPSGGNSFRGQVSAKTQHQRFNSTNVDDRLRAQGISAGDALTHFYEVSADLGGRIVRDKLWFYTANRRQESRQSVSGYAASPGPDGVYLTNDDVAGTPNSYNYGTIGKISYQANRRDRLTGFFGRSPLSDVQFGASRFRPYETTQQYLSIPRQAKLEWQAALSDRVYLNTLVADAGYFAWYANHPEVTSPSRWYRETGLQTGTQYVRGGTGAGPTGANLKRTLWREQLSSSLLYHPPGRLLGTHELSVGYRMLWGRLVFDAPVRLPNSPEDDVDNYQLVYDRLSGLPDRPVEFRATNLPVHGTSRYDDFGAYVSDTWSPTPRLTLNVGLRWQRAVGFVKEGVKTQGEFGSTATYPRLDVGTWIGVAPRVGVAYDLFGEGKTVVKGTYGKYIDDFSTEGNAGQDFIGRYDPNTISEYVYRWSDPDGNNDYTPGEVNLALDGPDFLSVSGATNRLVNPDLKQPYTTEMTASVEREIGGNASVRALYLYKKENNPVQLVNIGRPFDVWNRRFTRRDPGPDGFVNTPDDGGAVTFYDFDPAFRAATFVRNMLLNSDRQDSYHNIELMGTKRPGSGKWLLNSSLLLTKSRRWLNRYRETPNDDIFPLDETWTRRLILGGAYQGPFGINLSALYQGFSGAPGDRTYIFRPADPDGGPSLPSSGSITIRTVPFGTDSGPYRQLTNFRVSKVFGVGPRKVTLDLDAINAFNSNTEWGTTTYAQGPSYGRITRIVQPRALQLGLRLDY